LPFNKPAQIAGLVLSQQIRSFWPRCVAKQSANNPHSVKQLLPLCWRVPLEHCGHVAIRTLIKRRKDSPPLGGQCKKPLPFVRFGLLSGNELASFEIAEDAADISGVQPKLLADIGGGGLIAVSEFIQDSRFREREGVAGHSIESALPAGQGQVGT
jgi:hypothetical protein